MCQDTGVSRSNFHLTGEGGTFVQDSTLKRSPPVHRELPPEAVIPTVFARHSSAVTGASAHHVTVSAVVFIKVRLRMIRVVPVGHHVHFEVV